MISNININTIKIIKCFTSNIHIYTMYIHIVHCYFCENKMQIEFKYFKRLFSQEYIVYIRTLIKFD